MQVTQVEERSAMPEATSFTLRQPFFRPQTPCSPSKWLNSRASSYLQWWGRLLLRQATLRGLWTVMLERSSFLRSPWKTKQYWRGC